MIRKIDEYYVLDTCDTTYAFRVMPTGHLEHLYYGDRIAADSAEDLAPLVEKRAFAPCNSCIYKSPEGEVISPELSLEDVRLEMSTCGKGDNRESFIEIVNSDGSYTSDFLFDSATVEDVKPEYNTMPTSYYDNKADGANNVLRVVLRDVSSSLTLEIIYSVFEKSNVITRMTRLINESDSRISIKKIMSTQLDLQGTGFVVHSFGGAWAREMHKYEAKVVNGKFVNSSYTGTSSSRANPFVMISDENTDEDSGNVYGMNLVYSGNHYEALEASSYDKSRFVSGINPKSFEYGLAAGEVFEAPEAVMTFSSRGFNGMSHNMHKFVNNNIVRGKYKNEERPILINSWEANYFDINEDNLLELARSAKDVGIELFVMDDGWFGKRYDDTTSLGDWVVNKDKLPDGIAGIASKINAIGLKFGLWVEPEMVNEVSDLYSMHPDWALRIPGKSHSEGRSQMVLDLTRADVREYLIDSMSKVFEENGVSYVKWDMNRNITDAYSSALGIGEQGEVFHRYVLGFYEIVKTLTNKFPDILFEGCSSGGNRFDLGALCYYPQIWGSDDTDAYERVMIQNGYSYGYPQSTYTCHVSASPNHQTTRTSPLETRFAIAAFGSFGYECNLTKMSKEDIEAIREQIAYYKEHRHIFQYGTFYRGRSIPNDNYTEWTVVSEDKNDAISLIVQNRMVPNLTGLRVHIKGIDPNRKYTVRDRVVSFSAMGVTGIAESNLCSAQEEFSAYGSTLMNAKAYVMPSFVGTGQGNNVKYFQDLATRIFNTSAR